MNLARAGDGAAPIASVAVPDTGRPPVPRARMATLPYFDYLKQAYLINSRWLAEIVENAQLDRSRRSTSCGFSRAR